MPPILLYLGNVRHFFNIDILIFSHSVNLQRMNPVNQGEGMPHPVHGYLI